MSKAGEMNHALDMPLASMDWKGSLVQWSQTNSTMDIQNEESRLSRHFMGDTPKWKQPERIIWEPLPIFVQIVWAIPLFFSFLALVVLGSEDQAPSTSPFLWGAGLPQMVPRFSWALGLHPILTGTLRETLGCSSTGLMMEPEQRVDVAQCARGAYLPGKGREHPCSSL